jgi:hypothetical protein
MRQHCRELRMQLGCVRGVSWLGTEAASRLCSCRSTTPAGLLVYPTLTLKLSVSHLSDQLAKLIIREMSARISDSLSNVVAYALSAHNARVIIRQPKLTLSLYSQRTAQMLFVNAHLGPPNSAVHDVSLTLGGRQIALTLGMTSPQKVMEAHLADPSLSEELARIRAEVSQRLKRFCSDLSDEQFGAIVHAVCRCEFTEGLHWSEKEGRRKFFDHQYPSVDSGWLPTLEGSALPPS